MDKKGFWSIEQLADVDIDTKMANNVADQLRLDIGLEALKK
jgi:hypothetical protein